MVLLEQQLQNRLRDTFKIYICHTLEHALHDEKNTTDVLQVIINLQTATELLSKLYILRRKGWKAIVAPKLHNLSEPELLAAIESGRLRTTSYQKVKDLIAADIFLDEDDAVLLESFQDLRNQSVHLGVVDPPRKVLNEAIWFIVRIIHQLDWQETLPLSAQYLSNSLEKLLGQDLYIKLIRNSCYVDEAVDRAYEMNPDDVKRCLECGNESWVLDADGYRICQVCGYRGGEDTFGFIDCPLCQSKGALVYDPLNIKENEWLNGKCTVCRKLIKVAICPECENVHPYSGVCKFCGK